jgi:anti-anti-sigma regulatory factor
MMTAFRLQRPQQPPRIGEIREVLMLKIRRAVNGDVVLTLSGRLRADNLSELTAVLGAEPPGRAVVLDLKDVLLVDREIVRFLGACEGGGIALRNCPPYIRAWIAREEG